ncbi:pilus assembly protein [Actimicrobium antarcticum]|uniref:PilY1 beta-propeller domain-containing protein n=1 Tax=Actimicrobium antarcticum TaxID=1051899 RepID=A0ABP7TU54_9BURK
MTIRLEMQAAARLLQRSCCLAVLALVPLFGFAQSVVNLADQPLATTGVVPGNLLLALSVEFPTAISSSYKFSSTPYAAASTYLGYFDANKCYSYLYNSTTPDSSYFEPSVLSSTHICVSSSSKSLWSGNWLNWASMQTVDSFRAALTGGYRDVDTANLTILEKAWGSTQGSESANAPVKRVPTSNSDTVAVAGATPFNFASVNSRIWGLGNKLWISGSAFPSNGVPVVYAGQNSYLGKKDALLADSTVIYQIVMRVQVCKPSPGIENNCRQYGSNYKPEGLLQQYATKIRYGAFGYLNDGNINRDGGVLRAPMKFVGPMKPVPGQPTSANSAAEWSSVDGTFLVNPDASDATASGVTNSGVLNYLNKFGQDAGSYKTYDPISEMYYAAIRYFKNQGNVASYSALSGNAGTNATWKDGFPVVTNWVDPILYSCQKNFVLGIGDTNTHRDANLPGSTIRTNEPAMPSEVSADASINVKTATDMVGKLEGLANLGSYVLPRGTQPTDFMAGIAYDAHTSDIRPGDFKNADGSKTGIQTVSTFWLDVLESGYAAKNQFYLATKYGGFKVPTGFVPYATTNTTNVLTVGATTTPLTDAMWHNNADTYGADKRPDNYYDASAADKMVAGLQTAFASIASQLQEATTAFSSTSARVNTAGNASYQSKYDAASWSGDVIGNSAVFDALGNPTYTVEWNAKNVLDAQASRKIVTCCTITGAGLPFQDINLALSSILNLRTNYATFANVAGVPTASQSAVNYLAYLRGNRTRELAQTNGVYRNRTTVLGDIVNSKLTAVGPPEAILTESTNPGFGAFRTAYANRKTVVYVGANDGMMHAFDGTRSQSGGGGTELFAYVPSFAYGTLTSGPVSGLASLGTPNFVHHNLVDQTPAVFDMDLARTGGTKSAAPNWRSVLIGGLGKGGKGYYAIDVTDPSAWTSEGELAKKVLWEFTDSDMGYSYGDANVFKTQKYGWVVVLTSGYNNADGVGYFFIINPANGALLEKISTGFGSSSAQAGLTYASGYTPDFSDGTASAVYAGDLNGNVWRLDLSGTTGSYSAPQRIAVLRDPSGQVQPVTTRPLIELQPDSKKRYVLVGTGRLLDNSDIANSQIQSFYAIADGGIDNFYTSSTLPTGKSFPIGRADLNANTSLLTGIGSAPANPLGWYFDLSQNANRVAERINVNPTVNYGVVAFAANLPNGDACNPSGTNRIFAVNFGTGQSILTTTDATGVSTQIAFSSKLGGVVTDLSFANLNGKIKLFGGNNQLQVSNIEGPDRVSSVIKKLNWRELPTAN